MTTSRLIILLVALAQAAGVSAGALAQEGSADGERLFRTRCAGCHSVEIGQNRVGPHLADLIERTAGSVEGARYSRSLQDSGIVWSEQTLDAYLFNPRQAVPGTTMTVSLPDPGQRAAIIHYLRTVASLAP